MKPLLNVNNTVISTAIGQIGASNILSRINYMK